MELKNSSQEVMLMNRLKDDDQEALKGIFNLYKDKLLFFTFKFTRSKEVGEELVHDIFIKLWENRKDLNPEYSLKSYLYTITRNYVINYIKKTGREEAAKKDLHFFYDKHHNNSEDNLILSDYTRLINEAIEKLPAQRKKIFKLSREHEMTYEEIAQQMGISKNTVKTQMLKAIKTLKENLAHLNMDLVLILVIPHLL